MEYDFNGMIKRYYEKPGFFPGIGLYIKGNCSDYFTFYLTCNSKTIICASLADLVHLT